MTKYPIPLCGDHFEFEKEMEGVPDKERPDWPLPSFDARDWAEAFCKLNPSIEEDLMITWFANALMRGYDQRVSEEWKDRDTRKDE
jgi:hypothetical protein